MTRNESRQRAANRWVLRIIPAFITATFIFATYIVLYQICILYILNHQHNTGMVAGFLILYFVFFFLMVAAYLRLFISIQRDPGLVPFMNPVAPAADGSSIPEKLHTPDYSVPTTGHSESDPDTPLNRKSHGVSWAPPDTNPDSPGLELFYSKDVFVCEVDGRPKWCSSCKQWKPDRSHHSSELGRCVRKMDHLCPWVGGMVAERSFNFFAQFTFYCALYCASCLGIGLYTLLQQQQEEAINGFVIAIVVVSALFLLFSGGMALTSIRYCLINITNIDMFQRSRTFYLAVRIPLDTPPSPAYRTITYPLSHGDHQQQPMAVPTGEQQQQQQHHQADADMERDVPLHVAERDRLARRKFAVVQTQSRENPWDLGFRGNWRSVMGNSVLEWLLPIRHSPCCDHERSDSDYQIGPLVDTLRQRYGVPPLAREHGRGTAGGGGGGALGQHGGGIELQGGPALDDF